MIEIVGVKFRATGKVYNFLNNQLELKIGDYCVVETERGYGFGIVDVGKMCLNEKRFSRPLKNILRKLLNEHLGKGRGRTSGS